MNTQSYVALIGLSLCLGVIRARTSEQEDERIIRRMVDEAITRLNRGDVSAFADFWDEDADYVGVDGKLTKGRTQIQSLFRQMGKSGAGQQTATIEQIRFITPELAIVDGSWTVTGARDAPAKLVPAIKGRGFELVQKKNGNWKFIATREMVIFGGLGEARKSNGSQDRSADFRLVRNVGKSSAQDWTWKVVFGISRFTWSAVGSMGPQRSIQGL